MQTDGTSKSQGVELAAAYDVTDAPDRLGQPTPTPTRARPRATQRLRVPRHSLAVRLDGAFSERVSVGLDARYVTDLPDEPFAESAAFHSSYTVVNARVAYADQPRSAELYVRAENLFDAEVPDRRGLLDRRPVAYFGVSGSF